MVGLLIDYHVALQSVQGRLPYRNVHFLNIRTDHLARMFIF
jgi:hypothetical protein